MNYQKLIISLIILILTLHFTLFAQVIKFERTDVDNKDANFITATRSFGVDIRIDSIQHCSNVAFELSHNLRGEVKLSEWSKSSDWLTDNGDGVENNYDRVVTIVKEFSDGDLNFIAIECGTGIPPDITTKDNPLIIHLEFVVSPDAVHNEILQFNIGKVRATYWADTIVELTIPEVHTIPYRVHSYVIVMPGDANCDGGVDALDFSIVSKYLTEPGLNSRSFKRINSSILWQPQRCIAWDTLAATYADCDGNGVITTSDYNVIKLNYNKENYSYSCNTPYQPVITTNKSTENLQGQTTKVIPITISNDYINNYFTGIAGVIDLSATLESNIIKIEAGNYFSSNNIASYYYINNETNLISFCFIGEQGTSPSNIIAYITVAGEDEINTLDINQYIGFNDNNITQLAQATTGINDVNNEAVYEFNVYYNNNLLYINTNEDISKLAICNILGSVVCEYNYTANQYDVPSLQSGIYIVIAYTGNKVLTTKLIIR